MQCPCYEMNYTLILYIGVIELYSCLGRQKYNIVVYCMINKVFYMASEAK